MLSGNRSGVLGTLIIVILENNINKSVYVLCARASGEFSITISNSLSMYSRKDVLSSFNDVFSSFRSVPHVMGKLVIYNYMLSTHPLTDS